MRPSAPSSAPANPVATVLAIAVAVVAAAAFAGCAGAAQGSGATARDGYATAQSRATAWDSEAQLAFLFALEVGDVDNATEQLEADVGEELGPQAEPLIALFKAVMSDGDGYPGDGHAPAWLYFFSAPSGLRAVVVENSGSVTYDADFTVPGAAPPMRGSGTLEDGWQVDSDEAARIAAANNTAYAGLVGKGSHVGSQSLMMGSDGPVWQVSLAPLHEDNGTFAFVSIDATTGEVLSSWPRPEPGPGPEPEPPMDFWREAGEEEGTLTAVLSDAHELAFELDGDHRGMRLLLELPSATGLVAVRAQVTAPDGEEHEFTAAGLGAFEDLVAEALVEPQAGEWTVVLHLEQGTVQDYRFSWCTDGAPGPDAESPACEGLAMAGAPLVGGSSLVRR